MYLEAQLPKTAVERLVRQFAPIRIHMTPTDEDTHWLELDAPESVQFVPDCGVRIECAGRVRYSVAGVPLRFSIRSLHLLLRPVVADTRLYFNLEIEKSDLRHVPDLIDDGIMMLVNRALTPQRTRMVWDFGRTLSAALPMPVRLEPLDEFRVGAHRGEVRVDSHAIRFRVALASELSRYKDEPSDPDPPAQAELKAAQSARVQASSS